MKVLKQLLPIFAAVVLLSGCIRNAEDIKLPVAKQKLVAGCFISPTDSVIKVRVTRSNPIFGNGHFNNGNYLVSDAVVAIYDGSITKYLVYDPFDEVYKISPSSLPIVAGRSYELNVEAGGLDGISGTCKVPTSAVSAATVDITKTSDNNVVEVKWDDIPNESNNYRVMAIAVMVDTVFNDTTYNELIYYPLQVSDADASAGKMRVSFDSYYAPGDVEYNSVKVYAIDVFILNVETNYYHYFKSINNYTYDDPFAEPSPIYTNMKNGLGLFGGFTMFHIRKI